MASSAGLVQLARFWKFDHKPMIASGDLDAAATVHDATKILSTDSLRGIADLGVLGTQPPSFNLDHRNGPDGQDDGNAQAFLLEAVIGTAFGLPRARIPAYRVLNKLRQ